MIAPWENGGTGGGRGKWKEESGHFKRAGIGKERQKYANSLSLN